VLVSNAVIAASLPPQTPVATTVPSGQTVYYSVTVPAWAQSATNMLVSSSLPVNLLYFEPTNYPGYGLPPYAYPLPLVGQTAGLGPILTTNPVPPQLQLVPGSTYYLGVQNNNAQSASVVLQVDYDILTLTNGAPFSDVLTNGYRSVRYFAFNVSSNAYEATFQLLQLSGNADLVVSQNPPLPALNSENYGSFNNGTADENIYLFTNSAPVPLSAGTWYLGVLNRDGTPIHYSVLAKELDLTNDLSTGASVLPAIISLTNGVPFTWTAGPGAELTNFFRFHATNSVIGGTNVPLAGLRFELYNLSGNGDLTLQSNALPLAPPFFQSSQNVGASPELILLYTNSVLTNLAADWYLGVPNREITNISYSIVVWTQTNLYFPAFSGAQNAEGAGGGAVGAGHAGAISTVYHVTTTADSGPGSLRAAVANNHQTVVFDLGGTINLLSPLIITNANLTIAGQTAPGGGITVAGQITTVQNAHDVIVRDVRFRPAPGSYPVTIWFSDFGGNFEAAGDSYYTPTAGTYFGLGWHVDSGSVDVLTNGIGGATAYQGNCFVDLDGSNAGEISTNVTTVPGGIYTLNFAYSRNPDLLATPVPQAQILINGSVLATLTVHLANAYTNLMWQTASYVFTASSASTKITFNSLDPHSSTGGVFLSAVSLTTNGVVYDSFQNAAAKAYTQGQVVDGWTVLTNQSSVVTDPTNSYVAHSNFLALANGVISNSLPTVAGRTYTLSVAYRGPGIAAWWRGENSNVDSVGSNNGTYPNGMAYAAGEVGQAFNLNGVNQYVLVTEAKNQALDVGDNGSGLTFEEWIKPTVLGSENLLFEYEAPLGGTSGVLDTGVNFSIEPDGAGGTFIQSNLRETVASHTLQTPSNLLAPGVWQHVALTYDRASGVGAIYVNGISVVTQPFGSFVLFTSLTNLVIGARTFLASEMNPLHAFQGELDEISLYKRALSASEIKAIYADGSAGKFDPAVFSSSPAQSLAEAVVSLAGITNATLLGCNTNWMQQSFTFTATGSSTPVLIKGVEPGLLLDAISAELLGGPGGSLQFNAVSNVIADHISTSWSTNADLAVLTSTNVTVQWSIMADSLYTTNSSPTNPPTGSLLRQGSGALSLHHNLYADNYAGSPQLGDNLTLDFVNNVIYNWGFRPGWSDGLSDLTDFSPGGCTNQLNYVCNYLIAGPDTAIFAAKNYNITNIAFFGGQTNALAATWIFQTNNFIDSDTNGVLNGADTGWGMFTNDYTRFSHAFPTPPVGVDEAYQAYEKVLDFAGVNLALRDPADTNIVTSVRTQTGRLISSVPTLAGLNSTLPYLDTDQDGIPDFWESTFTPTLLYIPSNNNDRNGDGYTDLEEYNNWLAGPHALTTVTNPVAVDLYQLCGESGHLAFFVTNAVQGFVYLTNVLGSVTNTSAIWSNTIAVFTPTNSAATNYYGYAAFDCYVTNLDTAGYFGPVTVSVIVSAKPITLNSNFPPVITPLISGLDDPTNYGGSQFFSIVVTTNDVGALFELDTPTGPMAMVLSDTLPLPSLSSYEYYTNQPPSPANLQIAVLTNSLPVPLHPGTWYMAAVNESGSNVVYTAKISLLTSLLPPALSFPTNGFVTNILETVPWGVNCVAADLDTPPLPLAFALVSGPTNLIVSAAGAINWTPAEGQGPSTNPVAVSVSNGAFSVTNSFTIIVIDTNLAPVLPFIPRQFVFEPNTLVVTNTATELDTDALPLGYTLATTLSGTDTNQPVIDTNGIITWAPTLDQSFARYRFTTVVTNFDPDAANATSLSDTNRFEVVVLPQDVHFLPPGVPDTNIVAPGGINWFVVMVPTNAIYATNSLLFATLPVNLWFSTNLPPSITNATDAELLANVLNGVSVLNTNQATAPTNLVPGDLYFLGVQNTNLVPVTNALRVDFGFAPLPTLPPGGPDTNVVAANGLNWFLVNVPTNAVQATNLLLFATAPLNLWYSTNAPPTITNAADAELLTNALSGAAVINTTSAPVLVPGSSYYLGVQNTNNFAVTNAVEVDFALTPVPPPTLPPGQPDTNVVAANSLNWFTVSVPTNAVQATNSLLFATAPVNLWYSTNAPPSITNATDAELLTNQTSGAAVINTTSAPVLVPGSSYYLGVQNTNNFPVTNAVEVTFDLVTANFSIFSIVPTNNAAGSNGFLITWFAPDNDQFHLQWTPMLAPPHWTNFNGVISDVTTPTNGLFQYFDDGSQSGGFGPTRFYRLLLLNSPTNTAPFFLYAPGVLYANPTNLLQFTNTARDWDLPAQTLTYSVTNSLGATNLTINPATGLISWTPGLALQGQNNFITTTVTDSGIPPQSATSLIEVVVSSNSVAAPSFSSISIGANGVTFLWTAPAYDQFKIRWTTNLALAPTNWPMFPNIITSTNGNFSFVDTNALLLMEFYQLMLWP